MYNKTIIEFGFRMMSWIIKTSCLYYLPQPLVQGHVSEKSFSWAFYEHWSFFAETYSLNGAESKKSCLQFFQSHLGLFYAN